MPKLTDRQKLFAQEYQKDFCAQEAAIRAGYSAHTARSMGSQLLNKPQIRYEIDRIASERKERGDVEVDEIISRLREIAFGPPSARINTSDTLRACELLGKSIGMFTDRIITNVEPPEITDSERPALQVIATIFNKIESGASLSPDYVFGILRQFNLLQESNNGNH